MTTIARPGVIAAMLVAAASLSSTYAATTQVPGTLLLVKAGKLTKFIAKPMAGTLPVPSPGSAGDPTGGEGSFSVVDQADSERVFFADLPLEQWRGLGDPAGSKGYRYRGAGTPADPCRVVLVKGAIVKAVCRDDQLLDPPFVGAASVKLRVGTESYAALFAGLPLKNIPGTYKASRAPECSPSPLCCGGLGFHALTTLNAPGDCGDVTEQSGGAYLRYPDLACSGLYFGGGGGGFPFPVTFSGREQSITAITACEGQTATLGPTTAVETASARNCTDAGCLFGPPIAWPNSGTTPLSVCVTFALSGAVSGTLDCDSGEQSLTLPLTARLYLTGDEQTDPSGTIPGIQPCPICSAGVCIGGPNDGMSCVPAAGNGSTTHDCPPPPAYDVGALPLSFALSSGTVSWTATTATNDTGSTVSLQTRVFSGFCRDQDGTAAFANPAQECWRNGMAIGPACGGTHESCEQRNQGAFGPNGGNVQTIRVFGRPQDGIRCAAATGAMASLFSIPPTFDAVVDNAADLPGPGAVTIPVVGALCATADACPVAGPVSGGRVVFVTSLAYTGALGGLAGADAICAARAAVAGLPGTFKAWLSDTFTSAAVRLTHSIDRYVRVDGVSIANNWTDLTNGTLAAPIDRDEFGNIQTVWAWTATDADGATNGAGPGENGYCGEWTNQLNIDFGQAGSTAGYLNAEWTAYVDDTCNFANHLYCIQQ